MGYVWDLAKWLLGALLLVMLLNWMLNDDIGQNRPVIYWGCWVVALLFAVGSWSDRYKKNVRKRVIEEHQYQQAVDAGRQETPELRD